MHPLARILIPAAASLLLTLAAPALAEDASPAASASVSTAPSAAPTEVARAIPPERDTIDSTDRWDARMGFWIWPTGLALAGVLIVVGYATTPKPVDKVKTAVVTTGAGVTLEEDVE